MIERNKSGMLLFILSESMFFLLLILAYAFFHQPGGLGPQAANSLDVIKSGLFSLALFSSSATMWMAEVNHKKKNRRQVALWLLATLLLGSIFLLGQGLEYLHLLRQDITISRNLFGTTFFTLTSFHGFHVFIGLLLLGVLFVLAAFGKEREPSGTAMDCISIYWHFVDAVWIIIYAVIYLWKFL